MPVLVFPLWLAAQIARVSYGLVFGFVPWAFSFAIGYVLGCWPMLLVGALIWYFAK